MFYTVYKITNIINGKFYIGMHKTRDLNDGYMGSGKRLKNAIKCYGIVNFVKEILHVFDKEWKMKLAEKILVVVDKEVSYNLCSGGHGGFSYINRNQLASSPSGRIKAINSTIKQLEAKGITRSDLGKRGGKTTKERRVGFFSLSAERKDAIRASATEIARQKNIGSVWITHPIHGTSKCKIFELDKYLSLGYVKGRK